MSNDKSTNCSEDSRSELPDLLDGKQFGCRSHGELMLKKWGEDGEMWVFRKHPDGQWVSMRKATDDDMRKVEKLFSI